MKRRDFIGLAVPAAALAATGDNKAAKMALPHDYAAKMAAPHMESRRPGGLM